MSETDGLVCAYHLDGKGRATRIGWEDLGAAPPPGGFLWVHLDRGAESAADWLSDQSGLEPMVVQALLAEETRPRCTRFNDGFIVNLRGVNLNPGAEPEDMVSLRIWLDPARIVTVRLRRIMAVEDVRAGLDQGSAPETSAGLLVQLAAGLTRRMEPVIAEIDDVLDELEERRGAEEAAEARARIAAIRRKAALLRRFIGPQREALHALGAAEVNLLTAQHKQRLRETANDITRFVESLNAAWERAAVMNDELTNRLAEQTNQRLYLLSIVAMIFMPLSFVTGLLGVNVGGIPAADSAAGFALVTALLFVIGALEVWLFRRLRWL